MKTKLLYTVTERDTNKKYNLHSFKQVMEFTSKHKMKDNFKLSIKKVG